MCPGRREPAALERRLGPHLEALYRLAWRLGGEGAEQRLLQHLEDRARRGELAATAEPARRLAQHLLAEQGGEPAPAADTPTPRFLSRPPEHTTVRAALDGLAPGDALRLRLHHGDDYPVETLAGLFDTDEAGVRHELAAARHRLRAALAATPVSAAPTGCRPVRERLDGWLAGELDAATADTVGEHLSHCADCRAVTAAEQGLRRQLSHQPVPPPDPDFQARARAALNPPPRLGWLRLYGEHGWRRFTVPVLVAAVLAGLFVLWVVAQSASQPSPRSSTPTPTVTEDGRIIAPGGMNRDRSRDRHSREPAEEGGE